MQQNTLERRLDLLKMEGNGLLPPEITKELSAKYHVTRRTVQYDFKNKPKWQPLIEELRNALLKIVNRHDQLYRKASYQYSQVWNNDSKASLLALNLLRTLNKDAFDMLQSSGKIEKAPEKAEITAKHTIIWEAWKPDVESTD